MKRGQPMRRGEPLQRTPMKQGATARLSQSRAVYATMRDLVFERDLNSCIRCGGRAVQTHHRDPRGMGGSSRNPNAHSPEVLLSMCAQGSKYDCHNFIEHEREHAEHMGWLIPMGVDAETVSTLWHSQWVTLSSSGTVLFGATPPRLDLG